MSCTLTFGEEFFHFVRIFFLFRIGSKKRPSEITVMVECWGFIFKFGKNTLPSHFYPMKCPRKFNVGARLIHTRRYLTGIIGCTTEGSHQKVVRNHMRPRSSGKGLGR